MGLKVESPKGNSRLGDVAGCVPKNRVNGPATAVWETNPVTINMTVVADRELERGLLAL